MSTQKYENLDDITCSYTYHSCSKLCNNKTTWFLPFPVSPMTYNNTLFMCKATMHPNFMNTL